MVFHYEFEPNCIYKHTASVTPAPNYPALLSSSHDGHVAIAQKGNLHFNSGSRKVLKVKNSIRC